MYTQEQRKLHNEEFNDLYSVSNRRMGWAGHLASSGKVVVYTEIWWGNLSEKDHMEDQGVDGRIILRWIFSKYDVGIWTGSRWLMVGTGGGHL
jgi:hypothetical protein